MHEAGPGMGESSASRRTQHHQTKQQQSIRRSRRRKQHQNTAGARNNLGILTTYQPPGKQYQDTAGARNNLGMALSGKQHQDTAGARNNLGMALSADGKHDEAERLCADALATYERVRGKEHQLTLCSVEKLANVLQQTLFHLKELLPVHMVPPNMVILFLVLLMRF
eukprot:gene16569-22800_t